MRDTTVMRATPSWRASSGVGLQAGDQAAVEVVEG
jgi:hypothetical protein